MIPIKGPICYDCQRFQPCDLKHTVAYCEAFPDGIPDEILFEGFDHRNPFPGDNGIRFLKKEKVDASYQK